MARIAGVDLPNDKRLEYGLTYIYGIGVKTSREICKAVDISLDKRVKDLTDEDVAKLRNYIEHNVTVEGDLRNKVALNIKKLEEINSYRGSRHRKNLPVRGQNTKNNAKTRRGKHKTSPSKKA